VHTIERILQSNEEVDLTSDETTICIVHVEPPAGKRAHGRLYVNFHTRIKKKKCLINIKNKDNLCLARAIVVGKAHCLHN